MSSGWKQDYAKCAPVVEAKKTGGAIWTAEAMPMIPKETKK